MSGEDRLARLRRLFLTQEQRPGRALPDYWGDPEDLEVYDRFLAARIGWKWDAALDEAEAAGVAWRDASVVDWGCGTGIASRRVRARWGAAKVQLHDRSPAAVEFATRRLRDEDPALDIGPFAGEDPDLLLVDIESMYGQMDWLRARSSGRLVIAYTSAAQPLEPEFSLRKPARSVYWPAPVVD